MKTKIKKLLFELTRNSRITTKEISKELRSSQQSSSYLIKMLERKKLVKGYTTIIDAVKFGYINIIVGFSYFNPNNESKKEVLDELKSIEEIIHIEETRRGADIIVEFCSLNLSAVNKVQSHLMQKMNKILRVNFMFPVVVIHKFNKNYLGRKKDWKDNILCGDRELRRITIKEQQVLDVIIKEPHTSLVNISKKTKISIKSVAIIKKELERKLIIKGYSCIPDNERLGIKRYHLLLKQPRISLKEMDRLVEFSKMHKHVVELTKIMGDYQVILTIEEFDKTDVIQKVRENFPVEDYFMVESENIVRRNYLPQNL